MLAVSVVLPVQLGHSSAVYVSPSGEYSIEPVHASDVGLVTRTPKRLVM